MDLLSTSTNITMPQLPKKIPAFIHANIFVTVLVQNNDQYLLIEEAKETEKHHWYFPGGRVFTGETLTEAAIRETEEEAGIKIKPTGILRIRHNVDKKKVQPDWIRILMKAEYLGGEIKKSPDQESLQAAWLTVDQIKKLKLRGTDVIEDILHYSDAKRFLAIEEYVVG